MLSSIANCLSSSCARSFSAFVVFLFVSGLSRNFGEAKAWLTSAKLSISSVTSSATSVIVSSTVMLWFGSVVSLGTAACRLSADIKGTGVGACSGDVVLFLATLAVGAGDLFNSLLFLTKFSTPL